MFRKKLLTCSLAVFLITSLSHGTVYAYESAGEVANVEDIQKPKIVTPIKVLSNHIVDAESLNLSSLKSELSTFKTKDFKAQTAILNEILYKKVQYLKTETQHISLYNVSSIIGAKLKQFENEKIDAEIISRMMEITFTPQKIVSRELEGDMRITLGRLASYNKQLAIYQKALMEYSKKAGNEQYSRFKSMDNRMRSLFTSDEWRIQELNQLNMLMQGDEMVQSELLKYVDSKKGFKFFIGNQLKVQKKTKFGESKMFDGDAARIFGIGIHKSPTTNEWIYEYKLKTLIQKEDGIYFEGERIYSKQLGEYVEGDYLIDFEVLLNLFGFEFTKEGDFYRVNEPKGAEFVLNTLSVDEAISLLMAHL